MRHQPTMHITRTTMLLLQQLAQKMVLLNDVDFFFKNKRNKSLKEQQLVAVLRTVRHDALACGVRPRGGGSGL